MAYLRVPNASAYWTSPEIWIQTTRKRWRMTLAQVKQRKEFLEKCFALICDCPNPDAFQ